MHTYARLAPGPGFKAHRTLFYYAQRFVTFWPARDAVSGFIARALRAAHGRGDDALDEGAVVALGDLERDGLAELAPLAPTKTIDRMRDYFQRQAVLGPGGARMQLKDLPPETPEAGYDLKTIIACPDLMELVNAPAVLQLACAYLHCKPTLSSLGVRWSLPGSGTEALFQGFHRDIDDWRFLKLFVYLTAVTDASGPHCYVRTSHRSSFGFRERRYAQAEIKARFGAGTLRTITGPAGTTFIADTLGIHRGGVPTEAPRLMLQAQYSLLPVFAFQYEPVEAEMLPLDTYCNRLLVRGRSDERRSVQAWS